MSVKVRKKVNKGFAPNEYQKVCNPKDFKSLALLFEDLEVFGAPNIITKNRGGNEVWTYDRVSVEKGASDVYGTIIIVGGAGSRSSTSTRTFTLMIEFDDKGVVKDYSYRSSAF